MADHPFTPADEAAHPPEPHPDWEEWWYFDFANPDASIAGFARIALRPRERVAWWWSAVVGEDLQYVLVRDHDVPLPRPGTLEVRSSGLWTGPICETPFEHWSLGLEAFGVGFDDPDDAATHERGDLVPLGFDLEWECDEPPVPLSGHDAYSQRCAVHGDVLVGARRLDVDGSGRREHGWGRRDWTVPFGDPAPAGRAVFDASLKIPPFGRLVRSLGPDLVWRERYFPASSAIG